MKAVIFIFLTPLLILALAIEPDYVIHYICLLAVLAGSYFSSSNFNSKAINLFLLLYYCIGLLNISEYRGVINEMTMYTYVIYIGSFSISLLIFTRLISNKQITPKNISANFQINNKLKYALSIHLLISYLFVSIIFIKYGNILINQDARFDIPAWMGYVIRSTLPIIPFIYFTPLSKYKKLAFIALLLAPSVLTGARGTAISFILSYLIVHIIYKRGRIQINNSTLRAFNIPKNNKRLFIFSGLIGLIIIYSGFYLRRYKSDIWATPEELIQSYFFSENFLTYMVLPLYLAIRETIGLSNTIINSLGTTGESIFFADFYTVLPGSYEAAGKLFGDMIGRTGGGGLTPGIVGALYLDYGASGVIFLLAIAFALTILYKKSIISIKLIPIYAIALPQVAHLFHRGFPKPEYLTFLAIALIYSYFLKPEKYAQSTTHPTPITP